MKKVLAKVDHLQLHYGKIAALKGISFDVCEGEILAVVGPNGSGKTSAMECLEGLKRPDQGSIEVLGRNPFTERAQLYRQLGVQLQEVEYPDKIKVKEICFLFSALYEHPADWRLLLRQLDLEDKQNRMVKKLSGGEKQRLSILLALLPRPKLLVLDELTTGLDPHVRHGIWDCLNLIRQAGTSIIFVSHYIDEVERLADRLLLLLDGKVKFLGSQKAFREFAREELEKAAVNNSEVQWSDQLTLEEIYLKLIPSKHTLTMEGIL